MCLIPPITSHKKPSKRSSVKSTAFRQASHRQSQPTQPAARISNTTTGHSHNLELPISRLPPCLVYKPPFKPPTIEVTPAATDIPPFCTYVDTEYTTALAWPYTSPSLEVPTRGNPTSTSQGPSEERTHRTARRASILSEIDFVQTLTTKLAPPAATTASTPNGPSENEKKMQSEIERLGDKVRERERDEEIATAVAKAKAEVIKEDGAAGKQKSPRPSSSALSGVCSGSGESRMAMGQDGVVFHIHTYQTVVPQEKTWISDVSNEGLGSAEASVGEAYERRRSSVGDVTIGYAKRVMERMRGIEVRTAMLEREMEVGWERNRERDTERERRRDLERGGERYPGSRESRGSRRYS
jgi:hypothetical protein